jgi:hypothetical protein
MTSKGTSGLHPGHLVVTPQTRKRQMVSPLQSRPSLISKSRVIEEGPTHAPDSELGLDVKLGNWPMQDCLSTNRRCFPRCDKIVYSGRKLLSFPFVPSEVQGDSLSDYLH